MANKPKVAPKCPKHRVGLFRRARPATDNVPKSIFWVCSVYGCTEMRHYLTSNPGRRRQYWKKAMENHKKRVKTGGTDGTP